LNAPVDGPLRVRLDGQALAPELSLTIAGAFVRQSLNAPAQAEVTFAEPPAQQVQTLRLGLPLSIVWGSGEPLFEGELTAATISRDRLGGQLLRLRAYDPLHRLRKRQRLRTVTDASAATLAAEAAQGLGLRCRGGEAAPKRPFVHQYDQSDFELIAGLAGEAGYYLHLAQGELRLVDLGGEGEVVTLRYGRELLEASAEISAESLRRESAVQAVDLARAKPALGKAGRPSQTVNATLAAALDAFQGLGERTLSHRLDLDADAARRLAQADLDHATARGATLTATALGDPRLGPAARVSIEGLGALVDGPFVVSGALHSFTEDAGYLTEIWSDPPVRTRLAPQPLSTLGRVTDVDDPENLSRLRATLPACGDIESGWIPLVLPGAGAAKGLVALPEPGDDVLVLFPGGDPACAVALGGLYGERAPPGREDRRKGEARALLAATPSGAAMTLQSAKAGAELCSGGGDLLSLAPDGSKLVTAGDLAVQVGGALTIETKGDLTLHAVGRSVTIRAAAISLERG
jgi:phage baseplate assembly protein gpV/phage protein D